MAEPQIPQPARDPGWSLRVPGIDPEHEAANAALLEIGDGRIGMSGSPVVDHPAATPEVKAPGIFYGHGSDSELLPLPDCGRLGVEHREGMDVTRTLDLRAGVLHQRVQYGDRELEVVTFCSLARPGTVVLRAASDDGLPSPGAIVQPPGPLVGVGREGAPPSRVNALADPDYVVELGRDGSVLAVSEEATPGGAAVAARQRDEDGVLDRVAAYVVDAGALPDAGRARALVEDAEGAGFGQLLAEQRSAWAERWESCDIALDGDPELQLALRLGMFHLISLIDATGEAAVGARGTTGHVYRGHVFWDADVFVLPFAAATHPAGARAMLRYRARRLAAARAYAAAGGRAGARFPWESAATGEEATPGELIDHRGNVVEVLTGALQEHVTADVAWAVDHYLAWTADEKFARGDATTILVETARYWQSRVERDADGSCHIRDVIGPDEYHTHVDDNAYTNVMARWNLRAAAQHVTRYGAGVEEREVRDWLATAEAIVDGYDPATRVYEQFSGFFEREPLVAEDIAERPFSGVRMLGYERTEGSQVVKQNDVLLLHLNVPDEMAPGSLLPNLDVYERRTCHESSLSPGSAAEALARAGRPGEALRWLRESAFVDLPHLRAVPRPGLHTAAMGNTWRAVALGVMGLRPTPDALHIDPCLPPEWPSLDLRVRYQGSLVGLRATTDAVTIECDRRINVCLGADPALTVGPGAHRLR